MIKQGIEVLHLGAYNAGELISEWIDLPCIEEEIEELYERLQKKAESKGFDGDYEFLNADWDLPFEIKEHTPLKVVNEMVEAYERLDNDQLIALPVMMEHHGFDLLEAIEHLENYEYTVYYNCKTMKDVAEFILNEGGTISKIKNAISYTYGISDEHLKQDLLDFVSNYIDYEEYGETLEHNGHFYQVDKETCVEIHS